MSSQTRLSAPWIGLCRAMQLLAMLGALAILLVGGLMAGVNDVIDQHWLRLTGEMQAAVEYTARKQLLVTSFASLHFYSPLILLLGIWLVFGAFARGPALSQKAVGRVRLLGGLIVLYAMISVLIPAALLWAMTSDNPEGLRLISVAFGVSHLQQVLFGILLAVIGHVLKHALSIAEENGQFV